MKDQKWLNSWMDQSVMNTLVQKVINVYRLQKHHFDVLLDLYAELVQDIFEGKVQYDLVPNEYTFLKKLYWKFVNFQDKADRLQEKILKMLQEEQYAE